MPDEFIYTPIQTDSFEIATWQRITDNTSPVHIYIEGDGHAFNGRGMPTGDPTPRGTFLRDIATSDNAANVAYVARPCQYIMNKACKQSYWTDARFSARVIDSMIDVVRQIAKERPVILIGYSGGAMVSGLVIENAPDINIIEWVTIAGVLNHSDWTVYFGDMPLEKSMNMTTLPDVPQRHYVAENDDVIPYELSQKWCNNNDITVVPDATHSQFDKLNLEF